MPLHAQTAKKKSTPSKSSTSSSSSKKKSSSPSKKPNTSTTSKKPEPAKEKEKPAPEAVTPTEGKDAGKKSPHGKPATLSVEDLLDFEELPDDRKKLIEGAITVAKESPWLPYKFGGSSPSDGGFDCSGAMYYVMNKAGLKPPRTSSDQYLWIKEAKRLHETPEAPISLDHPSLSALHPGDLLFWSGTYAPNDGRTTNITHVAIYLGREKKDKRHVMINATDGRSYRGKQANGYGVYDFYLPKEGSRSKFVGYGTPPGITEIKEESSPSDSSIRSNN